MSDLTCRSAADIPLIGPPLIRPKRRNPTKPFCYKCGNEGESPSKIFLQTPCRSETALWYWVCVNCNVPEETEGDYWISVDMFDARRFHYGVSAVDSWFLHLAEKRWFKGANRASFEMQVALYETYLNGPHKA